MPPKGRTETVGRAQAVTFRTKARAFVEVAELVLEDPSPAYRGVAGSLAVLAAVAAGDAICGSALGLRSNAPDHAEAVRLLRTVAPGGPELAGALKDVLDHKSQSQYAPVVLGQNLVLGMVRKAQRLVDEAERRVR